MGGGFVRSYGASSTGVDVTMASSSPSSPHPVSNLLCCLLLLLLIIVSPISAVTYHDHLQSGGGVAAAAAGEINNIPWDLMMDVSRSGPPRHQQSVGDEQESKLRPPPAEQGAISPPSSVQAEGSEGQEMCEYEVSIKTSCSSLALRADQQRLIELWFADAGTPWVYVSSTQTWREFRPCSLETLEKVTVYGQCLERVCEAKMSYGGPFGEWILNYVTVVYPGRKYTICVNSLVGRETTIFNQCTAPTHADDEYYNSCSSADTANIDPTGEEYLKLM